MGPLISFTMSSLNTFLLVLMALHGTSGQHISCNECINIAEVLRDFLVYNESIISEQDTITTKICPEADLGDADAHPNCEKFTAHHWVDLATALFPALIDANKFCTDTLVCSKMLTKDAEVSCDSCLAVTGEWELFLVRKKSSLIW